MNAFVDPELCIGCTQCAGLCPAVFRMEGVLAVAEPGPIPPEEVPQAVTAAQSCSGHKQRKNIINDTIVTAYEP